MKKIILPILLFLTITIFSALMTKPTFAAPGSIYAISSAWDWRKGNSHNFQVGWEVGFQAHKFNPGTYVPRIYKKVKGGTNTLVVEGAPVYIYSGGNFYFYTVQPEDVGYSFIVDVNGKTDVYNAVAAN